MRQFIRHPTDIPIDVRAGEQGAHAAGHLHNVSHGGLAFQADCEIEPGIIVELHISWVRPEFETQARVVWCRAYDGGFELGVEFLSAEEAFQARMVEQVCHIENYKKVVYETEGRLLTAEEAALEWIDKYASQFPP